VNAYNPLVAFYDIPVSAIPSGIERDWYVCIYPLYKIQNTSLTIVCFGLDNYDCKCLKYLLLFMAAMGLPVTSAVLVIAK
jgi:hypothetical protein